MVAIDLQHHSHASLIRRDIEPFEVSGTDGRGRGHHRPGKAPLPRPIVRFLIWDATIFCHFTVRSEEKRSPYPPSRMGAGCRAERDAHPALGPRSRETVIPRGASF